MVKISCFCRFYKKKTDDNLNTKLGPLPGPWKGPVQVWGPEASASLTLRKNPLLRTTHDLHYSCWFRLSHLPVVTNSMRSPPMWQFHTKFHVSFVSVTLLNSPSLIPPWNEGHKFCSVATSLLYILQKFACLERSMYFWQLFTSTRTPRKVA